MNNNMTKINLVILTSVFMSAGLPESVAAKDYVKSGLSEEWQWNYEIVRYMYGAPYEESTEAAGFHFDGRMEDAGNDYDVFVDGAGRKVAGLRSEDGKVYLNTSQLTDMYSFDIHGTDEPEVLLYDFTCGVGDRFMTVGFDDSAMWHGRVMEVEVTVVDDVVYRGESHRRITYRCTDSSAGWFSVTEGLGPEQGLLCFPQYANLTSGGGHAYKTYYNLQSVTDTAGNEVWSAPMVTERTVVPGRTWWYVSSNDIYTYPPVELIGHRDDIFGLTLSCDEASTDGWISCHATDWRGTDLYGEPVARLREEDGRVWMIPNLHLQELPGNPNAEQGIRPVFEMFLGFAYGRYYDPTRFRELIWTNEPEGTPYLIYDFNFGEGAIYDWPWSGRYAESGSDDFRYMDADTYDRGFYIDSVTEGRIDDDIVKEYSFCRITKDGEPDNPSDREGFGLLSEGVGLISADFFGNYGALWGGFWICPVSYDIEHMPGFGDLNLPAIPSLVSVKDSDGTCIYGEANFDPASVAYIEDEPVGATATYDLQGRRVRDPERGMYVRGGKKVIVRR